MTLNIGETIGVGGQAAYNSEVCNCPMVYSFASPFTWLMVPDGFLFSIARDIASVVL